MLPLVGADRGAADRSRVLAGTLIQVQSDFARAGDRKLVTTASARLSPTLFTGDVLVVAVDRTYLDPRFNGDWTTDAETAAVRHTQVTARAVQRQRVRICGVNHSDCNRARGGAGRSVVGSGRRKRIDA